MAKDYMSPEDFKSFSDRFGALIALSTAVACAVVDYEDSLGLPDQSAESLVFRTVRYLTAVGILRAE